MSDEQINEKTNNSDSTSSEGNSSGNEHVEESPKIGNFSAPDPWEIDDEGGTARKGGTG